MAGGGRESGVSAVAACEEAKRNQWQ